MNCKKTKTKWLDKISVWLFVAAIFTGLGYAWCYFHWKAWALLHNIPF